MKTDLVFAIGACAALASSMFAQPGDSRRATFSGGGNPDSGRCRVEVVVDGAAEVEIRGDMGVLRNIQGQPPTWRRMECTGPLPANPADFRFRGIDGRGRQQLVADPRNNRGAAVIRIEDPPSGSEGYTFEIQWSGGGGQYPAPGYDQGRDRDRDRRPGNRFTTEQAVRVCQDTVREQAGGRFNVRDVEFLRTNLDDQPGRNDWVVGTLAVNRFGGRREIYRFSCSVNFDTGRVRSAQIEQVAESGGDDRDRRSAGSRAMDNCRRAVEDRLRNDGYDRINIRSTNVDNRSDGSSWIAGALSAERRGRTDFYDYSCAVDPRDGDIRSVDVRRPR